MPKTVIMDERVDIYVDKLQKDIDVLMNTEQGLDYVRMFLITTIVHCRDKNALDEILVAMLNYGLTDLDEIANCLLC